RHRPPNLPRLNPIARSQTRVLPHSTTRAIGTRVLAVRPTPVDRIATASEYDTRSHISLVVSAARKRPQSTTRGVRSCDLVSRWVASSRPQAMASLAALAESSGWDGMFLEDYIVYQGQVGVPTFDPWVVLSAMAIATSRIRLGTLVTPVSRRRPWKLACEA